jgi:transposase
MGKNPDINAKKAAQIDILLKEGLSGKEIAKKVQVSESVVSRMKKKVLKNISLSPKKKKNSGRKRITSSRDDKILIREALKNRKATCKMHQKTLTAAGVALSCRTINRRLSEAGLMARRPRKKQKITALNAKKRLIWAKQFITWTEMDWENVSFLIVFISKLLFHYILWNEILIYFFKILHWALNFHQVVFSDESIIQCTDESSQYIRRRSGEAFNIECVQQRVKHPTQVMVWSVMSVYGTGRLKIVDGTMRQEQYKTILESRLLPQLQDWANEKGSGCMKDFIFMHDGAPCHKGKIVTQFLESHGIQTLPWPGNSPDMNPIENLWSVLKKEMKKETITNKKQLIESLINVWHRNESIQTSCKKLIHSMPQRIASLKKAKGWFTKY